MLCFIGGQAGQPQKGQAQEKGGNPVVGTANKEKDVGADGGDKQTQQRKLITDKCKHCHHHKHHSGRICSDEGVVTSSLFTTSKQQ